MFTKEINLFSQKILNDYKTVIDYKQHCFGAPFAHVSNICSIPAVAITQIQEIKTLKGMIESSIMEDTTDRLLSSCYRYKLIQPFVSKCIIIWWNFLFLWKFNNRCRLLVNDICSCRGFIPALIPLILLLFVRKAKMRQDRSLTKLTRGLKCKSLKSLVKEGGTDLKIHRMGILTNKEPYSNCNFSK